MANQLTEYFDALERLTNGRPSKVPKGTKITNDSVSVEAGRGKGSIKKSRAVFAELIAAIDDAANAQVDPEAELKARVVSAKGSASKYRALWEEALAREASLLWEVYQLKSQLAKLTGGKVLPLRGRGTKKPSTSGD
jgi:hypothetical protein